MPVLDERLGNFQSRTICIMKNICALFRAGHSPSTFAFDSVSSSAPGNLPSIGKKKILGVSLGGGGWAQLELTDA